MDTSRYQLIDSLYGPGTVRAWLLSTCAVLIIWTLNALSRRKDTIYVDLIATLLLPLVAAGHSRRRNHCPAWRVAEVRFHARGSAHDLRNILDGGAFA